MKRILKQALFWVSHASLWTVFSQPARKMWDTYSTYFLRTMWAIQTADLRVQNVLQYQNMVHYRIIQGSCISWFLVPDASFLCQNPNKVLNLSWNVLCSTVSIVQRSAELQNFWHPAFFVLWFFFVQITVSHVSMAICKKIQNSVVSSFLTFLKQNNTSD